MVTHQTSVTLEPNIILFIIRQLSRHCPVPETRDRQIQETVSSKLFSKSHEVITKYFSALSADLLNNNGSSRDISKGDRDQDHKISIYVTHKM